MSTPLVPPFIIKLLDLKATAVYYTMYIVCQYYSICMELACLPKQANQSTLYTIQQLRSPFDLDQVKNVWRQSIFMFAQTPHTVCLNKVLGSIQ